MWPPDTGATYSPLLFIVPIVILLSVLFWIGITLMAEGIRIRSKGREDGMSHRGGPVMGGVVQGSPAQRNRRDFALTDADRRAAADRAEFERQQEAELRAERHRVEDARLKAKQPVTMAPSGQAVRGRAAAPVKPRRRRRWFR